MRFQRTTYSPGSGSPTRTDALSSAGIGTCGLPKWLVGSTRKAGNERRRLNSKHGHSKVGTMKGDSPPPIADDTYVH